MIHDDVMGLMSEDKQRQEQHLPYKYKKRKFEVWKKTTLPIFVYIISNILRNVPEKYFLAL